MKRIRSPRLLDCRKIGPRMSSLSFHPLDGGRRGFVAAHEGSKPVPGDYLALDMDGSGARLYQVTESDWCMNVDPANMWTANVRFIPGREAMALDLPEMTR